MGYKLLLADDSITIQKVVTIIFANEECELAIVDNGNAALEKAGEILPDIMLVDTLMPGTSGYEVCEKIRQNPALKATPLLLLTGAFEPFDVEKAKESGADDFISKPFESQVLVEKVKSLVQLGNARKAEAPSPGPVAGAVVEPEKEAAPEAAEPAWAVDEPVSPLPVEASIPEEVSPFPPEAPPASVDEDIWTMDVPAADSLAGFPVEEPLQKEEPADWVTSASAIDETAWNLDASPADAAVGSSPAVDVAPEEEFAALEDVIETVIEGTVEVTPDDDLWGAFELEPVVDDGRQEDIIETYTYEPDAAAPEAPVPLDEPFAAATEPAAEFPETVSPWAAAEEGLTSVAAEVSASPFEAVAADESSPAPAADWQGADDEPVMPGADFVPEQSGSLADAAAEPVAESYFFTEEPAPVEPPVVEEVPPQSVAPSWAESLSAASAAVTVEAPAVPAGDTAPVPPVGMGVTEAQIEAMVARISREVIERIVWEVVPDLAEVLIKEEIRKIKEGR